MGNFQGGEGSLGSLFRQPGEQPGVLGIDCTYISFLETQCKTWSEERDGSCPPTIKKLLGMGENLRSMDLFLQDTQTDANLPIRVKKVESQLACLKKSVYLSVAYFGWLIWLWLILAGLLGWLIGLARSLLGLFTRSQVCRRHR